MSGSPPQILTIGAPHSSTEARHSSTVSFSLIVCTYSRMRPQPVQVRLQACSGSSISTSGNRFVRVIFFLAMYPTMVDVRLSGKRMGRLLFRQSAIGLRLSAIVHPLKGLLLPHTSNQLPKAD